MYYFILRAVSKIEIVIFQIHSCMQNKKETIQLNKQERGGGGGGGYSHIFAIRIRAAGKGMVFKPFDLV